MKYSKSDCKAHDARWDAAPFLGSRLQGPSPRKVPARQLSLSPPACRESQGERVGRTRIKVHRAHGPAPSRTMQPAPGPFTRRENEGREAKSQTRRLRHVPCRTGGPPKSPRAGPALMGTEAALLGRHLPAAGSAGPPRSTVLSIPPAGELEHSHSQPLSPHTCALFPELKSRIIMRLDVKFHKKSS